VNLQFAQKAIIVKDGNLLMVQKSSEDPHNPNRWELPGGRMKEAETVDEHLCREVWEEVGLRINPGRPLSIWSWVMENESIPTTVVAVARICEVTGGVLSSKNHDIDDFLASARWVPLSQALDLDLMPSQQQVVKEIVAVMG
jgi:8-oxo-dGTP pyrophosphatase MutT (NUDIX family)